GAQLPHHPTWICAGPVPGTGEYPPPHSRLWRPGRPSMPDPSAPKDRDDSDARNERLRAALKLLTDEVRERIDRHPLGHLIAGRGEPLDLRLAVPTALRDGNVERAGREASEAIQE